MLGGSVDQAKKRFDSMKSLVVVSVKLAQLEIAKLVLSVPHQVQLVDSFI